MEKVAVGNSGVPRFAFGSPYMTAFGGHEVVEEGKDTGGLAETYSKAYWAGSGGCRWPAEECTHIRSPEGLEEAHGGQLAEGPCEGPSVACRFVSLVASPYPVVECGPSGFLVRVERRQLHSVSVAMLMVCASSGEIEAGPGSAEASWGGPWALHEEEWHSRLLRPRHRRHH